MKKDNFALENLARTLSDKTNSMINNAMFGKGATLGYYYETYIKLDNFNQPIYDFMTLSYMKDDYSTESTTISGVSHTHSITNPNKLSSGDRILCIELGADVVVVGKVA